MVTMKKQAKADISKDVNRGAQDEFEILALIVSENPHLRTVVLDRIRALRGRSESSSGGGLATTKKPS